MKNILEEELVKKLVQIRKEKNMTQQELAEKSSTIRQTIIRIESRKTSPQLTTMINLLETLGYTLKIVPLEEEK